MRQTGPRKQQKRARKKSGAGFFIVGSGVVLLLILGMAFCGTPRTGASRTEETRRAANKRTEASADRPSTESGSAEPSLPRAVKKSFWAYAWSGKGGDNIVPFFWIRYQQSANFVAFDFARAAAATAKQPEAHRVIFDFDLHRGMNDAQYRTFLKDTAAVKFAQDNGLFADLRYGFENNPGDFLCDTAGNATIRGIWWDASVEAIRKRFDAYFRAYKAAGGKLDMFVLDYEGGLSNWHLGRSEARYLAIQNDPRFAEVAKELGFSDLMTVCDWNKHRSTGNYLKWNAVMQRRVAGYVSRAVYEPIRKHFPHVKFSNYGHYYQLPKYSIPDTNGHDYGKYGFAGHVGTHQSMPLYASIGQLRGRKLDGKREYSDTPFGGFRLSLNGMRAAALSSDVPILPWISHKGFDGSRVRESDLYQELIFHVALTGADDFLFWNAYPWRESQDTNLWGNPRDDKLFSDCLRQLDDLVGFADRKTLVGELAGWYDEYALTGMTANGRSVWRLTPRLETNYAEHPGSTDGRKDRRMRPTQHLDRQTSVITADPPTFRIGDTMIAFPSGQIFSPAQELSQQGFWIVAPEDCRPKIVSDNKSE